MIECKRFANAGRSGLAALVGFVLATVGLEWGADNHKDQSEISNRLAASGKVLDEVMAPHNKRAIPEGVLQHARCVAIFPTQAPDTSRGFVSEVAKYADQPPQRQ